MKQRKKFEAWATSTWNYNIKPAREESADTYMEGETETAWMGWQAAIAAQEPKQAMTDAEILELVAINFNRSMSGDWIADRGEVLHFARAIIAASSPNKELAEALCSLLETYEETVNSAYCQVSENSRIVVEARSALRAAGVEAE